MTDFVLPSRQPRKSLPVRSIQFCRIATAVHESLQSLRGPDRPTIGLTAPTPLPESTFDTRPLEESIPCHRIPTRRRLNQGGRVRFGIYRDAASQWRWRLRAADGRIIARCAEGYSERTHCLAYIRLILAATDVPICIVEDNRARERTAFPERRKRR